MAGNTPAAAIVFPRVGAFPHEAYVARCSCLPEVGQVPTKNYHGHAIAAPTCGGCGRRFELAIDLMLPAPPPASRQP